MVRVSTEDEPDKPGIHGPRSADPTPTASKAVVLRSKDYFSTLPYGWIPEHGMQFFTLFCAQSGMQSSAMPMHTLSNG